MDNLELLPHHQRLLDASGIVAVVAAARGYRSVARAEDAIVVGFAKYQAKVPALLIPVRGVDGRIVSHQLRPDDPRIDKKGRPIKYEFPSGARMVLDIPPAVRPVLGDPSVPLLITEGLRKADAAVSHGGNCLALLGVYNFRGTNDKGGKVALPEWESIALNERLVSIAFDSDVMTNPNVKRALGRLADFLRSRGAHVDHIRLPPASDGGKQGLDDYLAAGHTMADVYALAVDAELAPEPTEWQARIVNLADVRPERVSWLWHGRIPLGKVTLLDGDPGLGKSTLLLDLAARVSTGKPMPDGSRSDLDGPAGVVILSAEDGLSDTIRPRLDAAGADVARVVALDAMECGEKERGVSLADLPAIETAILQADAKLVVIDPLMAYLSSETNSYRDQDVRGVLAPLGRLAEQHGVAIVIVRHLSKGAQANVLYRGGGSIGIIGAVRSALMVGKDPEDPDGPRRILATAKSNLAKVPPSLVYSMAEHENGTARIVWEGTSHHTADAITATMQQDDAERSALDEAKDILRMILADRRVQADAVRTEARQAGVSDASLRRAKDALGVTANKEGFGKDGRWFWSLPDISTAGQGTAKALNEPLRCSTKNDERLSENMSILVPRPLPDDERQRSESAARPIGAEAFAALFAADGGAA